MIVIAFSGQAGSGKTAAAKRVLARYAASRRYPFAAPIKAAMRAFGLSYEQTDGALKEVESDMLGGKTPRYAMQTLGTDWGRKLIADDVWVRLWKAKVLSDAPRIVVVDDLRFKNEVEAVHELGGVVVRIKRHDHAALAAHESEKIDFEADVTVVNLSNLFDFERAIDHFMLNLAGAP